MSEQHPHPADADCIFCRIIKGEIPSFHVYEDAHVFAFLDISPVQPGHILLLPKGHYPSVLDIPDEFGAPILRAMKRLGTAAMQVTGGKGFNCLQNTHEAAGQTVFHAHWHIIPRKAGDGLKHWPQSETPDKDAMQAMAAALAKAAASAI